MSSFSGKGSEVREVPVDVCEVEIELVDGIDVEWGIGRMVGVVVVVRGMNSRCSTIRITQEQVLLVNTRVFEVDSQGYGTYL